MTRPLFALLLLSLMTGACATQSVYVNTEADMGFYEVVAIAPFENLSGDATAAAAIARVFRTELWQHGNWRIVGDGDWVKAENDVRKELALDKSQPLSQEAIQAIGQKTGAQGIFFGTVRSYSMDRVGQDEFPLVAFSLQFVDAPSGNVIWDVSVSDRGGPKFPFFGFGESHTLAKLTSKLCRRALEKLP